MRSLCRTLSALLAVPVCITTLAAGSQDAAFAADDARVITPFNGKNLDGWKVKEPADRSHWTAAMATMDPAHTRQLVATLVPQGEKGQLVNGQAHGVDIYTQEKFGDCTIRMELMVPEKSNSGVYLMGEYEIQVLDSYGRQELGMGDLGAVYGVAAPRINAAKAPGQWQSLEIIFIAPRFQDGKKVANARIPKITLNDKVIQENLELPGVTPGGVTGQEAPQGPLMFQGDHGPVAYRNIQVLTPKE